MANSVAASPPAWMDGVAVNGAQMRRQVFGAVYPSAGIVEGLAAQALPTPAMKVRVPAGLALVDDGQGGFYPVALAAQTDLDIAASSATLARIDSVIAQVIDTGDATSTYVIRVVTGTPAASPVAPTLPPADAPGAFTLRIANVNVQANAESNGFVRAQDVSVVAASALIVPRPVQSAQITSLDSPAVTAGTWNDFTSGQWPPVSFVVPPSGQAYVSIGADVANLSSSSSYTSAGWRMSGGYTLAADFPRAVTGSAPSGATRCSLVTGMPAGTTVTVTPRYLMSSVTASRYVHSGVLIVEPVP